MAAINGQFWSEQFLKPNGDRAAGVRVFHYVAGNTTTNLDVFQNGDLTAPHANPVIGDLAGRVSFYGSGTYRLVVMTAQDDPTHPNITLYDWDPVEIIHHTATLRAEDRGLSVPAAAPTGRGRQFATTNTGGDITGLWIQKTQAAWQQILTLPGLTQMVEFAKGTNIASSFNVTIPGDGNFFDVTGTNVMATFSGFNGYPIIYLRTLSQVPLQHNPPSLTLLGGQNRITIANQITAFLHVGAGQWVELWYTNTLFGDGTFLNGAVLVGNGQNALTDLPLPTFARALGHDGVSGNNPSWVTGFRYHGPSATGAGSSLTHEGNVTISTNQSLSGIHCYRSFALNNGVTITVPANGRRLVIMASDAITLGGTITSAGAGAPGGVGAAQGSPGTDQVGGVGAGGGIDWGAGGVVMIHGCILASAGQMSSSALALALSPWLAMGGAGGGGASNPNTGEIASGGPGGGSIVLIAPAVTLSPGCVINTSGGAGGFSASGTMGGSGGGAGNLYILTRTLTDGGLNLIQTGGSGVGFGAAGGSGQSGVRQVMLYG